VIIRFVTINFAKFEDFRRRELQHNERNIKKLYLHVASCAHNAIRLMIAREREESGRVSITLPHLPTSSTLD
jgi:hypothetical protein